MMYDTLTYDRMPLDTFTQIDECIGKNYEGNFLIRYDGSRWVDINKVYETLLEFNSRLSTLETGNQINTELASLREEAEALRQENYELQQRLDRLELMLGEN